MTDVRDDTLLRCLTGRSGGIDFSRWEERDWWRLVEDAERREVDACLYQSLRSSSPPAPVPTGPLARLEELYCLNSLRNKLLYAQLGSVLQALRQHGVEVIVLKGAYLAQHAYGDVALRIMSDVDLLVKPADLGATHRILTGLGYQCAQTYEPQMLVGRAHHLAPFLKPGAVPVEIHWTLERASRQPALDPAGLWERSVPAVVAGSLVRRLSTRDLIVHLCLHEAYHHRWGIERWGVDDRASLPLRPMLDLAVTLRRHGSELENHDLARHAEEEGVASIVYCALAVAERMFGPCLPAGTLSQLPHGARDEVMVREVWQLLLTPSTVPSVRVLSPWQKWAQCTTWFDKYRVVRFLIFPSRLEMAELHGLPVHSWRLLLHYPTDLVARLARWSREVLRLASTSTGRRALGMAARRCRIAGWTAAQGRHLKVASTSSPPGDVRPVPEGISPQRRFSA